MQLLLLRRFFAFEYGTGHLYPCAVTRQAEPASGSGRIAP